MVSIYTDNLLSAINSLYRSHVINIWWTNLRHQLSEHLSTEPFDLMNTISNYNEVFSKAIV